MLRQLRALLRPLAIQAAYNPIETIVFFSIVGTLAYFHILNAIKHSAFFAPSSVPPLRPAHLILRHADWLPVREHVWSHPAPDTLLYQVQHFVFTAPVDTSALAEAAAFAHRNASSLTLAFAPGTLAAALPSLLPASSFRLFPSLAAAASDEPVIGDTASPKWIAYAFRALVIRFYTLAQMADSLDILLILLGYLLMHFTFYLLISRSRALGSNFWLPAAIMSSSILALLLSVPIALAARIPIDPVALTEALPFLVCTVGFDKPLRLARAVFLHPHLTTPPVALSSLQATQAMPLKPAAKILTESLSLTYPPIIRDYILEIAVLVVGANSRVAGLKEVCALAALLLAVDCLLICTYLVGVLGVMIEVRRIQTLRDLSKSHSIRSRSNSVSSYTDTPYSSHPGTPSHHAQRPPKSALVRPPPPPSWRERLLGVKGALLIVKKKQEPNSNPVARLKLLLIATFTSLHILNLITPLAPLTHPNSHPSYQHGLLAHDGARRASGRVDVSDPDVQTLLGLVGASPGDEEIVVRVSAPLYVKPVPVPLSLPAPHKLKDDVDLGSSSQGGKTRSFEGFMDSWTRLVGDPVLSKGIVVVLAISIMLNGYLIKGIAVGAGVGVGVGLGTVTGKALRFEGGEEQEQEQETERRTFTLEDVDRRLKARLTGGGPSSLSISNPPSIAHTPTTPTAVATPSPPLPLPINLPTPEEGESKDARAYEELVRLYDAGEGMHGKAEVLAGMSDEEVVLLVQKGKVAAYALEKVLSGGEAGWGVREAEVRRAVRVRRKVLCECFVVCREKKRKLMKCSPRVEDQDVGTFARAV
ncbi:hypothetical protein C0995_001857 [Termitomyces sp. Mi166|nr:hypothetical protein C0995_001857 [Termitomyces sp. Mi166\